MARHEFGYFEGDDNPRLQAELEEWTAVNRESLGSSQSGAEMCMDGRIEEILDADASSQSARTAQPPQLNLGSNGSTIHTIEAAQVDPEGFPFWEF
jgi:hypothetical protein